MSETTPFVVDKDALARAKAEARVDEKKCARFAALVHIAAAVMINILVWGLWAVLPGDRGTSYPWPIWVTFGTCVLLVAHVVSMIPLMCCRSSRHCPRWIWIVLGNILVANTACWIVFVRTKKEDSYPWPLWVAAGSILSAFIVSIAPLLCGFIFGKPEEHEVQNELELASSSESD
eukprot:TRINITY_DN5319_c0_g1_i1.p1 TRINITY_DN5319_c0_g1~~TRINITY_DN5319_c0_g1_i1.p1  ORF type:complete len:176 (+),score=23.99 TRINITY_DN5319_c0_g1_i1:30-557(+)